MFNRIYTLYSQTKYIKYLLEFCLIFVRNVLNWVRLANTKVFAWDFLCFSKYYIWGYTYSFYS
jgi:hypothetical protein